MTRDPDIISADQAAAFLGLGRRQVYDGAGRGEIPHRRVGKRLLFSRRALEAWIHLLDGGIPAAGGTARHG